MAPKRVDRAARREEILSAAVHLFARQGFSATRIEDVAAEAAIAKGSVYLYFDNREALLAAAFERLTERSGRILAQAGPDQRPALERLAALVHSVVTMLADEPELTRVLVDLWAAGRHTGQGEPVRLDMATVYREYRTVVAELLREAAEDGDVRRGCGDPEATVIVAAIEGCLIQWLMDPELDLADLADPITEVCLRGVGGHGSARTA